MRSFFLPLLFLLLASAARAQPVEVAADTLVQIELVDGSTLVGVVTAETDSTLAFRTPSGMEVVLPRAQIERQRVFEGRIRDGRVVRYDPNRTRLLFTPTARAVPRGGGYFAVYELVIPFVAVGMGSGVSLAGGTILFPGAFGRVLYVAPKVTLVERPALAVAVGGLGTVGLGLDEMCPASSPYDASCESSKGTEALASGWSPGAVPSGR